MMKNNRNIIECFNNIHQGVPCTSKQTCTCALDLGDASHVIVNLGADTLLKEFARIPCKRAGNAEVGSSVQ